MRGSRRLSQDWEKKSMPSTYDVTDEPEAVGGEEGAAQQLNQILASGLPHCTEGHTASWVILPTQKTRFRMPFSLPIPTWTSSEDRHRSPLG